LPLGAPDRNLEWARLGVIGQDSDDLIDDRGIVANQLLISDGRDHHMSGPCPGRCSSRSESGGNSDHNRGRNRGDAHSRNSDDEKGRSWRISRNASHNECDAKLVNLNLRGSQVASIDLLVTETLGRRRRKACPLLDMLGAAYGATELREEIFLEQMKGRKDMSECRPTQYGREAHFVWR